VSNNIAEIEKIEYSIMIPRKWLYELTTGLLERLVAFVFLVITLPILLLFAILIKIEDGGPVLYCQDRVGKDGCIFTVYKLRSMCVDKRGNNSKETQMNDPRITKVGKIIRMTRIDELPQLLNILSGYMKLIGPRPLVPEQITEYSKELPEFINRLLVKPGITGWAQVNGGNEVTPKEKFNLDMEYVKKRGLLMYVSIMIKTIYVVFSGDGAR